MSAKLAPGVPHANRNPRIKVLNVSIAREAYEIIQALSPTNKGYGSYIERLVFMDLVRHQEWQKMGAALGAVAPQGVDYDAIRKLYGLPAREGILSEQ